MSKDKIVLIGGGGHCRSIIDVIEKEARFEIAGIIDVKEKIGSTVLDYEVIGSDEDIETLSKKYDHFFITFGQGKSNEFRVKTYHLLKSLGLNLPVICSPLAHVSKHAVIGEGTAIMHGCIVNAAAKVGVNCILNTQSLIEHDVEIGDHCHISTKSAVNGFVKLGDHVFTGSSSVFADRITICSNTVFGAGTVTPKSITEPGIYVGNPARKIK